MSSTSANRDRVPAASTEVDLSCPDSESSPGELPGWRAAGQRYFSLGRALRARFGRRVQKVSIDAGFTCPNVDGSVAVGGCSFCDNRSFSPSRRLPRQSIRDQIDEGIKRLKRRYQCEDFLAYFQPATNTYAPVDRLRTVYQEALAHPQVVGLAIGTRPDCVGDDVLALLEEIAVNHPLYVEYGMQTIHDRSLDWMNRGHHHDAMVDAVSRSRGRGFEIGAHVILGLPGETHSEMLDTAREIGRLDLDSIKIHNLYVVHNTRLAEECARGETRLMERDEYVRTLVDFIEILPPSIVIERITGEAPSDFFVGPTWALDKSAVRNAVDREFEQRDSWQGKWYRKRS
ncbi:MAG: TIGR01212 family radical SAM protein [Pirellulales bacterium]|nr:TIGR01212 family radical SAM protein [Pirellulales bacterium]